MVDAQGVLLVVALTPANVHDSQCFADLLDAIPALAGAGPGRLGRHRWVVERAFAWLNKQRRLHIRFDRRATHYHGFLELACALICLNYIKGF